MSKEPSKISLMEHLPTYSSTSRSQLAKNSPGSPLISVLSLASKTNQFLALRLDDFDEGPGNGQLRFDNILITGTAVPEPSSALLALAGIGILARRRRS